MSKKYSVQTIILQRETVDIDIFMTFRMVMSQNLLKEQVGLPQESRIKKWNEFSKLRRTSTKVITVDYQVRSCYLQITWLNLDYEGLRSSSKYRANSFTHFCNLSNTSKQRFGHQNFIEQIKGSNICRGCFNNGANPIVPVQFRRERKPSILKDDFSSRIDPSIF